MGPELVLLSGAWCRGRDLTRPRMRNLLALLADDPRAGCGTARLVAELWPDERPANPPKALQVLVSHTRALLGQDVIVSTPVGYRIGLREDEIDAAAVLRHAATSAGHARTGDHAAALDAAEKGLVLWDGPPDATAEPGDPVSALRAARAVTHGALTRERALALSRLGRHAGALSVLTELAGDRPRDEEVLAELLRSEAATAGPAAALARYATYQRTVRDELGGDPGPVLRAVHEELLAADRPVVRRGVPHAPNPLLGRDADVAAVAALLRTSRVTSIVGAGGLGKTRLAHVLCGTAGQRAVFFVELAGVTGDGGVAHQVASVVEAGDPALTPGARPVGGDVPAGIAAVLGQGPALLVLDNCEHVVAGAADLVATLVALCADLRVLTTSRAPLGLSSESVYLLPELALPTAVDLFGQRARAARPGVALPDDAVAEVCRHLDGLPLAVELAAARVRVMSVGEIARHLDDRFALLRGGPRDAPARHRTLHAVIDWSWHLLDERAQAAMRALSVFPGGFTTEAARHLLGDDVLPVLEQLTGQSLLTVTDTVAGARFRMLETVREFSADHRARAGESADVTRRFLAWARDFGVAHRDSVFGDDPVAVVAGIRAEQDNLVQALRHAVEDGDGATVAATSAVLGGLWTMESSFARMATLGEEPAWILSHYRPEPALVEVTRVAVVLAAMSAFLLQGPGGARSLVTLRRLPPPRPDTMPRAMDVVLRTVTGAAGLDALPALCEDDAPLVAGLANGVASQMREAADDVDGALAAARRMLAAFEAATVPALVGTAHSRVGELCLRADLPDEARHHIGVTLEIVERVGAATTAARARWVLVLADLQRGAVDEAERGLDQVVRTGGDQALHMVMFDVAVRAEVCLARGQVEEGLLLWRRVADRLCDEARQDWWSLEGRAVAVTAHAHHGRLDLVDELTGDLPVLLGAALADTGDGAYSNFPVCGALLLALGLADLARGTHAGVAMIALAQRFHFTRGFRPTMSPAAAARAAEEADGPAYRAAMARYDGLAAGELRAVAATALRDRAPVTAAGPA
jgi:predicted ATPase